LNASFIFGPSIVFERRDIKENDIGILGIKGRGIIGVKRVPRRVVRFNKFLIELCLRLFHMTRIELHSKNPRVVRLIELFFLDDIGFQARGNRQQLVLFFFRHLEFLQRSHEMFDGQIPVAV
jgi:hypothetical protein